MLKIKLPNENPPAKMIALNIEPIILATMLIMLTTIPETIAGFKVAIRELLIFSFDNPLICPYAYPVRKCYWIS